ncbi:MAG: hypothetical protein R3254_05885 [Thiomicrorhabdus sp.]|nr:hypothetical protein [Thiomicrorhabdus sp.]
MQKPQLEREFKKTALVAGQSATKAYLNLNWELVLDPISKI